MAPEEQGKPDEANEAAEVRALLSSPAWEERLARAREQRAEALGRKAAAPAGPGETGGARTPWERRLAEARDHREQAQGAEPFAADALAAGPSFAASHPLAEPAGQEAGPPAADIWAKGADPLPAGPLAGAADPSGAARLATEAIRHEPPGEAARSIPVEKTVAAERLVRADKSVPVRKTGAGWIWPLLLAGALAAGAAAFLWSRTAPPVAAPPSPVTEGPVTEGPVLAPPPGAPATEPGIAGMAPPLREDRADLPPAGEAAAPPQASSAPPAGDDLPARLARLAALAAPVPPLVHLPAAALGRLPVFEGVRLAGSAFDPGRDLVRFYHPQDAALAARASAAVGAVTEDFTSYAPKPPPGSLELWLRGPAPE